MTTNIIETIDLPKWPILDTIKERMIIKYKWTEEKTDDTIEEYKKFVFLIKYAGDNAYTCPPTFVDDIWHQHILFTKQYSIDSLEYFGRMVHHLPSDVKVNKTYQYEEYGKSYDLYFKDRKYMKMFHNIDDEHCTYSCDLENCCCSQK
jgi:hypothetical protein